MRRIYLTGQKSFGNRGCEAIVRSTVDLLRTAYGDVEVMVPSLDIKRDSGQWPEADDLGVKFVPSYLPRRHAFWVRAQKLPFAWLKGAGWPFPFPQWLEEQIASVDAVLSVGGDNYSLDYRLPSLLQGMDALGVRLDKPVVLWGASIGPFEQEPHFVPAIRKHLARMNHVMVRETVSYEYATESLGLSNVSQMVDPAFGLTPKEVDCDPFWPDPAENGVLGVNISPLIERYKNPTQNLVAEVASFVNWVVRDLGMGVLLIPHVVPLDGSLKNNDSHYMHRILDLCRDLGGRLRIMPSNLNAAQSKHVLGLQRFFIGARTHATIAALSSQVPTISIAYSIKARGINRDIFGHEEVVLPTTSVSSDSLRKSVRYLIDNEPHLRKILSEKMPSYRASLRSAITTINV